MSVKADLIAGQTVELLCKEICPYCGVPGLNGFVELHDGRYHTRFEVPPSYENVPCRAAYLRDLWGKVITRRDRAIAAQTEG